MAQIIDFDTDVAKVRLLIADLDDTTQIFNDEAIQAFIDLAVDNNLKRAAAQALLTIATNEVLVQKRIKLLDIQTDGPAQAKELRELAKQLIGQAETEEATEAGGAFDWAEMVHTPAQWDERLYKESQRT